MLPGTCCSLQAGLPARCPPGPTRSPPPTTAHSVPEQPGERSVLVTLLLQTGGRDAGSASVVGWRAAPRRLVRARHWSPGPCGPAALAAHHCIVTLGYVERACAKQGSGSGRGVQLPPGGRVTAAGLGVRMPWGWDAGEPAAWGLEGGRPDSASGCTQSREVDSGLRWEFSSSLRPLTPEFLSPGVVPGFLIRVSAHAGAS